MAGAHTGGWRPLSAGDDVAPESAPVAKPALPPGTPWPWGAAVFLACAATAVAVQLIAGWTDLPPQRPPGTDALPTLRWSAHLGSLHARTLDPGSLFPALLLQVGSIGAVLALLGLALVAPLAEALRGRSVWLELWLLVLVFGQLAQELDPLGPPGDGVGLLPALTGFVAMAALILPPEVARASQVRVVAWSATALVLVPLLLSSAGHGGLALACFVAGGLLAFAPKPTARWAGALGALGLVGWTAGAGLLAARAADGPAVPMQCGDLPAEPPPSPRNLVMAGHEALALGCPDEAVAFYDRLDERFVEPHRAPTWDNNLAWAMALALEDEPAHLGPARLRAERAVAASGAPAAKHTLATVQVLQGDLEAAQPNVRRLLEQRQTVEYLALGCLLPLAEDDAAGIDDACGAFLGVNHPENADLYPLVWRRLTEHPVGRSLLNADD